MNTLISMQPRLRDLSDKAVVVAAGLGSCGLENQESLITQLGKIAKDATVIRDESFCCTLKV